ncbi:MAG TPA: zinc ribbon-containing protein [Gammaproteobacteria bacterium]|nr:zinc ribbon-containing protein [Gammaproteobacteria bacterium]
MSEQNPDPQRTERLSRAYNHMMERVKSVIDASEKDAIPTLQRNIEQARDKAVELGELSRDEADKVALWVRRDTEEAARYLSDTGLDLRDWLRIDLGLIEDRVLDSLFAVADRTRLDYLQFQEELAEHALWQTGEITGPGVLRCAACGEEIHFHQTGRIPPCPACHATTFRRPTPEQG